MDKSTCLSSGKEGNVYIASQLRQLADLVISASTKGHGTVKVSDGSSLLEPLSGDGATSVSKLRTPVRSTSAPIDDPAEISIIGDRTSTVKGDDPKCDDMSERGLKSHLTLQLKRLLELLDTRTTTVVGSPRSLSLEDVTPFYNLLETPQTDVTPALKLLPSTPFFSERSEGGYVVSGQAETVAGSPSRVDVESGTETQRNMEPRDGDAIGRAKIWLRMLEARTQSAPALSAIEQENVAVLDQGVILPCAPSDEEKVNFLTTTVG